IQGPWSAHLERCRAEVREVLEGGQVPSKVRKWLRDVEASLAKRAHSQLLAEASESVNELRRVVENPAAPERLWAIRELVAARQTAILRELLDPKELGRLILQLGFNARERAQLRRELALPAPASDCQKKFRTKARRRSRH